jgi:cathepsin L
LVSLSEKDLVDCSNKEGNQGCEGGLMDDGFQYVKDVNGIDTEACYPYKAVDESCRHKTTCVGATLKSWVDVPSKNEQALQKAVATVGPVSVAIDAGSILFQFYRKGVYTDPFCSQTNLDHGVTAVGYGTENGKDYWLVKVSLRS